MNESQELVLKAVARLNEMALESNQTNQSTICAGPFIASTICAGPFIAEFADGWESISFMGERGVWCPETDQCETPDTGETVESIIYYIWHYELKDLTNFLNALAPLMPEYIEPKD